MRSQRGLEAGQDGPLKASEFMRNVMGHHQAPNLWATHNVKNRLQRRKGGSRETCWEITATAQRGDHSGSDQGWQQSEVAGFGIDSRGRAEQLYW